MAHKLKLTPQQALNHVTMFNNLTVQLSLHSHSQLRSS